MVVRYVDSTSGNDAWDGLAPVWVAGLNGPKASLTGMEATPVLAGDLIHVRAGVYRETLTCGVSGAAGQAIEYRGDYTGAIWAGGVVRITGSNNDQTAVRASCIVATSKNYRTFTGFTMDGCSAGLVIITTGATNWTVSNCHLTGVNTATGSGLIFNGTVSSIVIQGCYILSGGANNSAWVRLGTLAQASADNYVQNCVMFGGTYGMLLYASGTVVRNCLLGMATTVAVFADTPGGGAVVTVNNCSIYGSATALQAAALGDMVEDYNNIYAANTARSNVGVGANSLAYPPLFDSRWFFELVNAGRMLSPFDLASYSQLVNVAGWLPTATDMRGTGAIGGVRERGALEYDPTLLIRSAGGGAVSISPLRGNIG